MAIYVVVDFHPESPPRISTTPRDANFRWDGPKRKQTLLKAKLGRLLLTDKRLLFLSTGKSDIKVSALLGGPAAALRTSATDNLDLSNVEAAGGLNLALEQLRGAELKGMFKALTVTWLDDTGEERAATFAPKNGGMPEGSTWVAEIQRRVSSST